MFSEVQKKKVHHLFNVLDANQNGVLQMDDFVQVAETIVDKLELTRDSRVTRLILIKANRLFVQFLIDTNQPDLSISLWDWMKFFEREIEKDGGLLYHFVHRTTFHIFSLFDLNGDKHISREEYEYMWSMYKIPMDEIDFCFAALDKNGDQLISVEEMVLALNDFFYSSKQDCPGNFVFGKWQ